MLPKVRQRSRVREFAQSTAAEEGGCIMRGSVASSKMSRIATAVCAIWLCYASPAWAGGGGADSGSLLFLLSQICSDFFPACPQYPAYLTPPSPVASPATPIVVELAAWQNRNPD